MSGELIRLEHALPSATYVTASHSTGDRSRRFRQDPALRYDPSAAVPKRSSMPKTPTTKSLDRALATVAAVVSKSSKLSTDERAELKALGAKAARANSRFTMADRARCVWLIRKAGPKEVPPIKLPPRIRRLLGLDREPKDLPTPGTPSVDDPLSRLERLGKLRGRPLTEAQFEAQRDRLLLDPAMADYGRNEGVDPLDRIASVAELTESEVLTKEQSEQVVERILNAS